MPGLPGAACRSRSMGDEERRHASACSRPPEPTRRTRTARVYDLDLRALPPDHVGVGWGAVVSRHGAEAYDLYSERYAARLAREHVRRLRVRRKDDVLEIGCGVGALTAALADRVGAKHVRAVEPSEAHAEACRLLVPGADVRIAPLDALPDFGVEFAAATSQLVVNVLADADSSVRAMRDAVRREGIVASVVWDYKSGMTVLRTFWDAALEVDPRAPDEGRLMPHCTPSGLRTLWHRCELEDVVTQEIVVNASYESFDDLWRPFLAGAGAAGAYLASLEADERDELRDRCFRRLGAPEGRFALPARAWVVLGVVRRRHR